MKLMRTGICPRSRGGFQTTWPRIVLTAIVNSGWRNGGITAGKQYFCCSSTLLLCLSLKPPKMLVCSVCPLHLQREIIGTLFYLPDLSNSLQIPRLLRFPCFHFPEVFGPSDPKLDPLRLLSFFSGVCSSLFSLPFFLPDRNCGNVFCAGCCHLKLPIPDQQLYDPVLVCNSCYDHIQVSRARELMSQHLKKPIATASS